ncbi:MAG TPA: TSUP family transporter, partial [Trebonia sp.]
MVAGEILGLFAAGVVAGLLSSVVSLASIVSYPALLAFGLSPLAANVTNTVALVFTGLGAAAGSRPELAGQGPRLRRLGVAAALGGAAGAALLLITPASAFELVAPLLIATASVLLLRPPRPRPHEHLPV